MSTSTLSEAAEKRKERLLALKKRKRGQTDDLDQENERNSLPQNDPSPQPEGKPYLSHPSSKMLIAHSLPLSGRNYDPSTRTTKLGFTESPLSKLPEDFETVEEVALNLAIEAIHEADKVTNKEGGEVDLFSLQPKRPNWDLKRDVEKKLERLKPKTDAAIARLVRNRLLAERKEGKEGDVDEVGTGGDLAQMVEMREREEREESI